MERQEIIALIKKLVVRYHASYAILFGSYARGEETKDSDIDLIIVGGEQFHPSDIFDFGEELREMTGKDADVFEIREIDTDTDFYRTAMSEGVRIAWRSRTRSKIAGLRHRLVHDYEGINWIIIADELFDEMDPAIGAMKDIVREIGAENDDTGNI